VWGGAGTEGQDYRNPLVRLLAFFGLISYSLYLWHWPVAVFYRHMLGISAAYVQFTRYDKVACSRSRSHWPTHRTDSSSGRFGYETITQTRRSLFTERLSRRWACLSRHEWESS